MRRSSNCRSSGFAQLGCASAATDKHMNALACELPRPTEDGIRIVEEGT